jgi:hypothetical protein
MEVNEYPKWLFYPLLYYVHSKKAKVNIRKAIKIHEFFTAQRFPSNPLS